VPQTNSDLDYVARIRNKFAHWPAATDPQRKVEALTFQDQQVAAWVSLLNAPKRSALEIVFKKAKPSKRDLAKLTRIKLMQAAVAIWLGLEACTYKFPGATTREWLPELRMSSAPGLISETI
jgi:hypothetical protein